MYKQHLLTLVLAATSMTLLDNLTAQLSPDRKVRFIQLFRQLQVCKKLVSNYHSC